MRKLTRNKSVTLRMTETELNFFRKNMSSSKITTQTDFILAVLDKKPIVVINDFHQVLAELKRQGHNLNQISKRLNESGEFNGGAKNVMNECWATYKMFTTLGEEIKNAIVQGEGLQIQTEQSTGIYPSQ